MCLEKYIKKMLKIEHFLLKNGFTAMGIRKKIQWQFYFYFCCRKGQIQGHYNGKNLETWKLSEGVIIILFSAIRLLH